MSRLREHAHLFRAYFTNRGFILDCIYAAALFSLGTVLTFFAGIYASDRASNYVTDIVLSNVPVFQVNAFFVYGTFAIILFVGGVLALHPKWIPFTLASLGLFYCIRAVFISLTHLAPFPSHITLDVGYIIGTFIGGDDLFFSGHTGAPFLLALIFWSHWWLRYTFLAWSVFFAIIVLLGHLHYSIDVLAAYFITYTIFHISKFFFKKYWTIFREGVRA